MLPKTDSSCEGSRETADFGKDIRDAIGQAAERITLRRGIGPTRLGMLSESSFQAYTDEITSSIRSIILAKREAIMRGGGTDMAFGNEDAVDIEAPEDNAGSSIFLRGGAATDQQVESKSPDGFYNGGGHSLIINDAKTLCYRSGYGAALVGDPMRSGKHQVTVRLESIGKFSFGVALGLCEMKDQTSLNNCPGWEKRSWSLYSDGFINREKERLGGHHDAWVAGDEITLEYNADSHELQFFRNGVEGSPISNVAPGEGLCFCLGGNEGAQLALVSLPS